MQKEREREAEGGEKGTKVERNASGEGRELDAEENYAENMRGRSGTVTLAVRALYCVA